MSTKDFDDLFQEYWNNLLTPEEQEVFFSLTDEEQDKYLEACSSYEAMKAYLENPDSPPQAKRLLSLDNWK